MDNRFDVISIEIKKQVDLINVNMIIQNASGFFEIFRIADSLNRVNEHLKAISVFNYIENYELPKSKLNNYLLSLLYFNRSSSYDFLGDYKNAFQDIESSLFYFKNDTIAILRSAIYLTELYRCTEAYNRFTKFGLMPVFSQLNVPLSMAELSYSNFARILETKKDYKKAILYLNQAYDILPEYHNKKIVKAIELANLYKLNKDFKNSNEWIDISIQLSVSKNDSIFMSYAYNEKATLYSSIYDFSKYDKDKIIFIYTTFEKAQMLNKKNESVYKNRLLFNTLLGDEEFILYDANILCDSFGNDFGCNVKLINNKNATKK